VRRMTASHWDNEKPADLETQPDSDCPHCTQVTRRGASLCEACGGTLTLTTTTGTSTLETHHTLWAVLSGRGYSLPAQPHLVKGLALTGEASTAGSVALPGHDVGVCCRNHLAVTRWELGRADDAAEHARQALDLAARLGHPLTYATAVYVSAWVHYHRGDHDVVERLARTLTAHALEAGLDRSWEIDGRVFLHSGRRRGRHSDEELAALEPDIVSERSGRSAWRDAFMRCLIARAHLSAGRPSRALEILSRLPSRITNGNYAPEVYRLTGEALLAVGAPFEHAEVSFRNAIWLARARQVVAFELRAGMSLALLLARRGEGDAASAMLGRIYAVYGEGFETADLRRAQQLLESLA
jgi:tetratricopeptide (TPR) repeat protein